MSFVLLAFALAQASAAVPVRLPAGESVEAWAEAIALAGLSVGTPGEGPWVEILASGGQWIVRVEDRDGVMREAPVPAPRTAQDREDVALLAASMLQPMRVSAPAKPAPTPTPAPTPARAKPVVEQTAPSPAPAPVPAATGPVWPPSEPVAPTAAPAASEPVMEAPPPAAPTGPTLVARFGVAGEARLATRPTVLGWAELQGVGEGPFRPALGFGLTAPATLPELSTEVAFWGGEAWAGAWYAATAPVRFDLGLAAGLAARSFVQDGEARGVAWVPTIATRLEAPVRVAPSVLLEPGVHVVTDLSEVDIVSRADGAVRFGDWALRLSLGVRIGGEKTSTP